MKTYTITGFKGFWPVGTAAVVSANSKEEAKVMLEGELRAINLAQDIDIRTIRRLKKGTVEILLDGDY